MWLVIYMTADCTGQGSPFSSGYHSGAMTPGMTGSGYDAKRHVLTSTPGSSGAPRVDQRPDKNIKVTLDNRDLWRKFHSLGTEMIITKSGRFVHLRVTCTVLMIIFISPTSSA